MSGENSLWVFLLALALFRWYFERALRLLLGGFPLDFNLVLGGLIFLDQIRFNLRIIIKFLWRWLDQERVFYELIFSSLLFLRSEDFLDHPGLPPLFLQLVKNSLKAAGDLGSVESCLPFRHV